MEFITFVSNAKPLFQNLLFNQNYVFQIVEARQFVVLFIVRIITASVTHKFSNGLQSATFDTFRTAKYLFLNLFTNVYKNPLVYGFVEYWIWKEKESVH